MPKTVVELERPQRTWHMRVACWISMGARAQAHARARAPTPPPPQTQRNMYYLMLFHINNGYANAPHYYVIRTLPVLFTIILHLPR